MQVTVLKSKIMRAKVTGAELYYEGSLTLDPELINRAGFELHEQVQVVNLNNGERFTTYVIEGEEPGSGEVVLNGPAARLGYVGDQVIILTYAGMTPEEARTHVPIVVQVDDQNQPLED
ncbi:MAG: aspartate 1-decarboxylase [bacterium]